MGIICVITLQKEEELGQPSQHRTLSNKGSQPESVANQNCQNMVVVVVMDWAGHWTRVWDHFRHSLCGMTLFGVCEVERTSLSSHRRMPFMCVLNWSWLVVIIGSAAAVQDAQLLYDLLKSMVG